MDDASVYWTENSGVAKVSKDGGMVTVLATNQYAPSFIALDATSVYWTDDGGGSIVKVSLGGGSVTTLTAAADHYAIGIALGPAEVYWTNAFAVLGMPLDGDAVTTLAPQQNSAMGIAVDATSVYWANQYGTVMKMPLAGPVGPHGARGVLVGAGLLSRSSGTSVISLTSGTAIGFLGSGSRLPIWWSLKSSTISSFASTLTRVMVLSPLRRFFRTSPLSTSKMIGMNGET